MILCKITHFSIESSNSDLAHTAPCSPNSSDVSPSPPHLQLIMNIEDEFGSLQVEMEAQWRHTTAIQESLDTLLVCLGVIDNERQQGTPPSLRLTASSNAWGIPVFDGEEDTPLPIAHNHLKPRVPPSFYSDHRKGCTFMNLAYYTSRYAPRISKTIRPRSTGSCPT